MRTPKAPVAKPPKQANEVRIIGGQWKRSKLKVADKPGLRPTPDRVRETLFNWLAHLGGGDLAGWRCLDAFAGTGALGFEAASRGAAHVQLIEQDPALVVQLAAIQIKLSASTVHLHRADGISALKASPPASLDLVFLDPPFNAPLIEPALKAAAQALQPSGHIYLEAPSPWTDDKLAPYGLAVYRYLKAGAVHAHLLART